MIRSLWFFAVAATLCRLCSADAMLDLRNPGFEEWDTEGSPAAWTLVPRTKNPEVVSWKRSQEEAHGAGTSVCGGIETRADDAMWTQRGIAVPDGTKYLRVTAWMKAEDVRSSAGAVAVHFHDAGGATLQESVAVSAGADCDWSRYVGYVAVPEETVTVSVHCFVGFAFTKCGRFWWDDLALCPVDRPIEPVTGYVDDTPPPVPTEEEKERGFIAFSRSTQRAVFPNAVPLADERIEELSLLACPGEYEPGVLILYALRDLEQVRLTTGILSGPSGEIPVKATEVRSVRFMTRSGESRWGRFNETIMHDVPHFLEKRNTLTITTGWSQPYWLTVAVPDDAKPGRYEGVLRVTVNAKTLLEVPLTVEVRPFKLANPKGTSFGMYARMRDNTTWIEETFADLCAHGMNGLALIGSSGYPDGPGGRARKDGVDGRQRTGEEPGGLQDGRLHGTHALAHVARDPESVQANGADRERGVREGLL